MNIKNFETHIDDKILNRGSQYYNDGYVKSLSFINNEWQADVAGSDDYIVTVKITASGDITFSDCDCPYEFGEYCKHKVAVFYAIVREWENPDFVKKNKDMGTTSQNLEDILKRQDNAILVSVLLDYARKDKQIKDDLLLRFSKKNEEMAKHARNLIKTSINVAMRRGFVEYADTRKSVEGADKVLHMARDVCANTLLCSSLCVIVLQEMSELLNCCDDSNGYVGGVISEAVELIDNTINSMPENHPDYEKVFDLVFSHACGKTYDELSDWHHDILNACMPMCCRTHLRKRFENYLLSLQTKNCNKFHEKYITQKSQDILYNVIKRYDGYETAYSYMEQNLENSKFRKVVIQQALDEKRLNYALSLCLDGEDIDSEYPGTVSEWRKLRYIAYEKLNDIESQRKLAKDFVIDGKFEYFLKLKDLYASDEWAVILETLLQVLKDGRNRHDLYVRILINEKLKEYLLAYCKTISSSVVELYPHLLPDYKNDVEMLFVGYIRNKANTSSNRNQYQDVCKIINHYQKACGNKKATRLTIDLLKEYHKRPAFVDELKKLNYTSFDVSDF